MISDLCRLIAQLISGVAPHSVEEGQSLVVVPPVDEEQIPMSDELYEDPSIYPPTYNVPPAIIVKPKLTMFEWLRECYKEIESEVFCSSHEEYMRQQEVFELARKYSNMSDTDRSALQTKFKEAILVALKNQRTAGMDPLQIHAARLGQFDMQKHIENAPKMVGVAQRELCIICGESVLNEFLESINSVRSTVVPSTMSLSHG